MRSSIVVAATGLAVFLSACALPFNLGQPTTRSLETEATAALGPTAKFSLHGTYTAQKAAWTISMAVEHPDRLGLTVSGKAGKVAAVVIGDQAYFSGREFLAAHFGTDQRAQALVQATGNAWWKGSIALVPTMPDLTTGDAFRTTFLGAAVNHRTDDVTIDGELTAELSGPRADVYIREAEPHYLVHVRMTSGAVIDGISGADFGYATFDGPIDITAPSQVIDFSNLTTLPPIYTVVSVDTTKCASPCVVSALLKNLGGLNGAQAPSTVKFTLAANSGVLGTCETPVSPDVGYNQTTTVTCTIEVSGAIDPGATVTATADNPGHA